MTTENGEFFYRYNAAGQRICKESLIPPCEYYILDEDQILGVIKDDSLLYWNIWGNGTIGRAEPNAGSLDNFYYLQDHLGSTRQVVNETGFVQEAYDYYPFGIKMPGRIFLSGMDITKNLFTGKEQDKETRWYYFGARFFHPAIGKWLAVDPLADKHPFWSPYVYTFNNPINFFDPNGKEGLGAAIRQNQQLQRRIKGEITQEQHQEQRRANATAALLGASFFSLGKVADGILGTIQDIATGDFGLGSLLNFVPGGNKLRAAAKLRKLAQPSFVKGLTKGELQRFNVAGKVKLGQITATQASQPLSKGGAAVNTPAILGSGKVIKISSIGNGKFEVTVDVVQNGKVVGSNTTTGTAKELGIENLNELTKKGSGFDKHFLQDHED